MNKDTPQSNSPITDAAIKSLKMEEFDTKDTSIQSNTDWREKLRPRITIFDGKDHELKTIMQKIVDQYWEQLEPQISQLLEAKKKRWREEVEGMKQPFKVSENMELREAYNSALDAVLQKLS